MKTKLLSAIVGIALLAGCATQVAVGPVPPPEPVVYYGWYGNYYGPYYWDGPVVVFGCPAYGWHGWHGHYYHPHGPVHYRPGHPHR